MSAARRSTSDPYRSAPARAFWSRAVARGWTPEAAYSGPMPLIRPGERVASAGSCFAANVVPYLEGAGFAYVRTEPAHPLFGDIEPEPFGYSKFSAAYGNVYTARQMLQLVQRSTGAFSPAEDRWEDEDGLVDPFRPGLRYRARSARELELLRAQHLARTREALAAADVFVFTLGLTEAWLSREDGAVFPACPGTVAGTFDPDRHVFHNFTTGEVADDLAALAAALRAVNPAIRLIFTVSPVPLVATATGRHVLEATTYSKSVLRAAAGEAADALPDVVYFPAYEIVTGPQAPDGFFEPDRRNVSEAGIQAVMAALLKACGAALPGGLASPAAPAARDAAALLSGALGDAECEEAMADRQASPPAPDPTRRRWFEHMLDATVRTALGRAR